MPDWRPEDEWIQFLEAFEKMGKKWDAVYTAFCQGEYRNPRASPLKIFHETICSEIGEMRMLIFMR